MTGTHRAVNQARPSWKATADKTSAGSIWVQRIGMTLLGLALLAAFVALLYYLFLNRMSEVHFVSLRISDYGQLHAPPIAFAAEDHQALEEAAPQPHDVFFHAIDDTESENSLARLQETCGTVSAGSVLVVYLTAHGISDDNQPWLLASNYAPTVGRAPPGRIALKEVLATLMKAPARQKLLVLDTGRLEQDPAQGMLVNEFPLLVEQEVKALQPGKQSLYVMLPAQFLETSQVSPREQRSAFNQYFVDGWLGAADSNSAPDELLSLGEWFAYTRERTSAWVWSASGKTSQQTPVLLQAGVGRIEPTAAEQFILRRLPAKQVAKETNADEKKNQASAWRIPQRRSLTLAQVALESTDTKKSPAEEPKAAPPLPMPAKTEPPPSAPAVAPPADDQSTAALAAIHDARQRLESQWFGANTFTPADFAPHVWRELERRSAGYERAALASSATNDAKEGQRRAARLQVEFQNAEQALNEQRALWEKSARLAILTKHPDLQAAVVARDKATLELHELLRLAFYRPTDGWPAGHLSRLKELQSRTLALDQALAHTLARDDSGRLTTTSLSPDVSVQRVAELATAVEQLRSELHTTSVLPRGDAALANQLLNELLHSSLLNADERRDARAAWRARNQQLPLFAAADLRAPTTSDVETWRTKRAEQIRQAAALEIDFAQFLAAELPAAASQSLAGCGELPALDAAGLQKINHCGHSLQLFYQQVAAQVNELAGVPALSPADVVRLERLMRWQCDTTSASIAAAWANVLRSGTYEIQTAPQRLSIQGPIGVEATASDGSVPIVSAGGNFTWQIGPATQLLPETVLQIEYDDKLLVVEQAGGRALPPRSAITVKAADKNSSDLVPIVLRVAPRPGEESGKTATLSMRAVGDKQLALTTMFQLPEPKWLDLFVKGWPGTVADLTPLNTPADAEGLLTWQSATGSNGQSKLLLQPFPSHSSPFELKLGNRSQKVRKITYRVWTVPADKQRSRQRGWKPWEANGELVREAEQLSEQQLEIPAAGSVELALFPQPKPPMPTAPGATPAPPAVPMPVPPAALLHAERGIICEFVSTDGFAPPQRLWLDVAPLHPSQYVEVGFTPNLAQRSIAAKLSLIPNGPHRWPTHDCDVRWEKLDTADPLKPAGRADTRDLLKNPLTISEQLPPGKESANVVLSIDGYPRAMEYLAPLFGKAERIQSRRSYLRLILLTQDKEQKPVTITERTRYFQTLDKIDYWVQADVPPTGSGAEEYLFRVHVVQASDAGEQGEDTAREYLADRDFTVELSKDQTAAGRFWLRSRVDDLRGTLKLAGLTNRVVTIKTEILQRSGDSQYVEFTAPQTERLVIDNEPPQLALPPQEQAVAIGAPLKVAVKLADQVAGVREVLWSWQLDAQGNLKEPQTLDVRSLVKGDPTDTRSAEATLELPTKDWTPGTRKLRLQAIDRCNNANIDLWEIPIRVIAATTEPMPEKKDKNALVVVVQRGGKGERGIEVVITGPESRRGSTDGNGQVKFDDLPPGDYTAATARGEVFIKNRSYTADPTKATVAAPPKPAAEALLMLK